MLFSRNIYRKHFLVIRRNNIKLSYLNSGGSWYIYQILLVVIKDAVTANNGRSMKWKCESRSGVILDIIFNIIFGHWLRDRSPRPKLVVVASIAVLETILSRFLPLLS